MGALVPLPATGSCSRPAPQCLLHAIATRTTRALDSQGLLLRDDETPSLDLEPDDGFEQLLGTAVHYRIATGPHAGRKALTLRTVASQPPPPDNPCIAQLSGVSLHAGTCCRPRDRDSLERLCRCIARPTVSNEPLSVNDRAQVVERLKHPFGHDTTHGGLDPIDFSARLAALVPRPRPHLTPYHRVFAPNFKHRQRIIPNSVHPSDRKPQTARPAPMRSMQRLKRVFLIDIEYRGVGGGTLRVFACIDEPELIERILTHLATRNNERIRFRVLDPALSSLPAGLEDAGGPGIALDAASFAALRTGVSRVFMTENEINFLAFPRVKEAMVVFGAGYGFERLDRARWLGGLRLCYWGTWTPTVSPSSTRCAPASATSSRF